MTPAPSPPLAAPPRAAGFGGGPRSFLGGLGGLTQALCFALGVPSSPFA